MMRHSTLAPAPSHTTCAASMGEKTGQCNGTRPTTSDGRTFQGLAWSNLRSPPGAVLWPLLVPYAPPPPQPTQGTPASLQREHQHHTLLHGEWECGEIAWKDAAASFCWSRPPGVAYHDGRSRMATCPDTPFWRHVFGHHIELLQHQIDPPSPN